MSEIIHPSPVWYDAITRLDAEIDRLFFQRRILLRALRAVHAGLHEHADQATLVAMLETAIQACVPATHS